MHLRSMIPRCCDPLGESHASIDLRRDVFDPTHTADPCEHRRLRNSHPVFEQTFSAWLPRDHRKWRLARAHAVRLQLERKAERRQGILSNAPALRALLECLPEALTSHRAPWAKRCRVLRSVISPDKMPIEGSDLATEGGAHASDPISLVARLHQRMIEESNRTLLPRRSSP